VINVELNRFCGGCPLAVGRPDTQFLRDEALHQAEQRLQLLSVEMAHKQSVIDQHLRDADERMDALKACGMEIVALRQQVLAQHTYRVAANV
jgi:hypothetical protein